MGVCHAVKAKGHGGNGRKKAFGAKSSPKANVFLLYFS